MICRPWEVCVLQVNIIFTSWGFKITLEVSICNMIYIWRV